MSLRLVKWSFTQTRAIPNQRGVQCTGRLRNRSARSRNASKIHLLIQIIGVIKYENLFSHTIHGIFYRKHNAI